MGTNKGEMRPFCLSQATLAVLLIVLGWALSGSPSAFWFGFGVIFALANLLTWAGIIHGVLFKGSRARLLTLITGKILVIGLTVFVLMSAATASVINFLWGFVAQVSGGSIAFLVYAQRKGKTRLDLPTKGGFANKDGGM